MGGASDVAGATGLARSHPANARTEAAIVNVLSMRRRISELHGMIEKTIRLVEPV
jgi:hypothetical protein